MGRFRVDSSPAVEQMSVAQSLWPQRCVGEMATSWRQRLPTEVMLLACRCLYNVVDILPCSRHSFAVPLVFFPVVWVCFRALNSLQIMIWGCGGGTGGFRWPRSEMHRLRVADVSTRAGYLRRFCGVELELGPRPMKCWLSFI